MSKKIFSGLMAIVILIGMFASFIFPIYIIITTICLKNTLPQWYLIINVILSGLSLTFLIGMVLMWLSDDKD